jgi:hypothetical protein
MKQNDGCHVQNIHGCAINCVILSLLIQQLILLFFNTVRASGQESGLLPPRSAFAPLGAISQSFRSALVSMRIRIQHFRSLRIRFQIQDFDHQKFRKKLYPFVYFVEMK